MKRIPRTLRGGPMLLDSLTGGSIGCSHYTPWVLGGGSMCRHPWFQCLSPEPSSTGILEANFIDPTHNKQDFERTSLFQKLEARLKAKTAEYWRLPCGLIGYQTSKRVPSKKLLLQSLHPGGDICKEHDAGNGKSYRHDIPGRIREEYNPKESVANMEGHDESRSNKAAIQLEDNQDAEMLSLIEENDKLRSELVQIEKREEELNLKLQHLEGEVDDARSRYARLLVAMETAAGGGDGGSGSSAGNSGGIGPPSTATIITSR
ncbi:hypothetical protein Cgig2_018087 [Carnegiea gigantea]|uniref:Morc S5 domain-containing protein n=1 Tax=Carnegiea gigantea TaxID=171969 RepID=A0A9Q1JYN1_9CARY|nr:hypothetical protein Cgig2_018087 [Carnegiea gigantea]